VARVTVLTDMNAEKKTVFNTKERTNILHD